MPFFKTNLTHVSFLRPDFCQPNPLRQSSIKSALAATSRSPTLLARQISGGSTGHFSGDKSRVDRPTRHPIAFAFDTWYLKWRRKEPPLHFSRASLSNWDFIGRRNHNFQINYNVKWQHINAKYCIGVSRGVDIYEILMNEIVHASSIIILLSTSFSTLNGWKMTTVRTASSANVSR